MRYEAEVRAAIARWAPVYGVVIPEALVHAIIEKESTHGLALVTAEPGGRHSYGPMMVLDATARGLGASDPAALMAPAIGIDYGVKNLAQLLKRFGGDFTRAVSAYNAWQGGNPRRNAQGNYPNQSYVTAVLGFWKRYGGAAAAVGLPLLAAAAVLLVFHHNGRARRAA